LKIRHGAIVDNVVTSVYAKSDDDRFRNKKALGLTTTTTTTMLVALGTRKKTGGRKSCIPIFVGMDAPALQMGTTCYSSMYAASWSDRTATKAQQTASAASLRWIH